MSDNSFGSFVQKNKIAILSAVGVGAAALSAYYYLNQLKAQESASAPTATSKNKKKKSKKKAKSPAPSDKPYPVTSEGYPEITEEYLNSLSPEKKDELANTVKEDGNEYFKRKEFAAAIEYYSAALAIKEDPVYYSNRSACYVGLEDYQKVVEDTSKALELKPDYTKCLLRRANAYEQLENYEESMFDLTALTIYGGFNNKSIETVLDRVLRKHSFKIVEKNIIENSNSKALPSPSSISSFFGAFEKETGETFNISKDSLVEDSADYYLYNALENLNLQSNEGFEKADKLFEQAVEAYQKEVSVTASEATPAQLGDEIDKSLREKLSVSLEYLGILQFLKSDPLTSLDTINKSLLIFPRPRSYIFNALILTDKQDFDEAFKLLDKALELTPKHASEVYYHKAQLFYLRGELEQARENFLKAQQLNPENVYSYIQLACIEYRQGHLGEAEKSFKEAKLKFPTSPEIPNYYGEILADKGDVPAALKQFEIASKLQEALYPKISVGIVPIVNKATIILKNPTPENIVTSSTLLAEAVELDSKSELAKVTLAQIRLQENNVEAAIKLFEEASLLSRNLEEKLQSTSFAEASKVQLRVKDDAVLGPKMREIAAQYGYTQ